MENEITPLRIEQMALDARLQLTDVLAKSGVSPSAYYRWRRAEGDMRALNRMKLVDAIAALSVEAAA
jgi:hypothetical protein